MTAHDNPVNLTDEQLDQIIGGIADWAGRMPPELEQYPGGGEGFLAALQNYRGQGDNGPSEHRIPNVDQIANAMSQAIRADAEEQMKAALNGNSLSAAEIAQHQEAGDAAANKAREIIDAIVGRGMQSGANLISTGPDLFANIRPPKH